MFETDLPMVNPETTPFPVNTSFERLALAAGPRDKCRASTLNPLVKAELKYTPVLLLRV
jgi:hypothetical protein